MTELFTLKGIEQKLQKAGRKQARLYLFSNFIALMIISAYAALMMSQTECKKSLSKKGRGQQKGRCI